MLRGHLEHAHIEVYTYTFHNGDEVMWDISMAKHIVETHPEAIVKTIELPTDVLRDLSTHNEWTEERVKSCDPSQPGLAAVVMGKRDGDGPDVPQYFAIVIDGTHRGVKALREGKPFSVRVLSDTASRACALFCSPGRLP
jgi:hypothetical protein